MSSGVVSGVIEAILIMIPILVFIGTMMFLLNIGVEQILAILIPLIPAGIVTIVIGKIFFKDSVTEKYPKKTKQELENKIEQLENKLKGLEEQLE